jgi:hypothetical protein
VCLLVNMALFVQLTEYEPAFDLVTVLNRLNGVKPAVEPKAAPAPKKEEDNKDDNKEGGEPAEEEVTQREDPQLYAARHSKLGRLVESEDFGSLLSTGFFPTVPKLMSSSPNDIDTAFALAFSLLPKLESKTVDEVVPKFTKALTSDEKTPQLKLQLLSTLFNLLDGPSPLRHVILVAMLKLALSTKLTQIFAGQFSQIADWISQWELSSDDTTQLYKLIAQVTSDSSSRQNFIYKYLESLGAKKDKTAATYACETIVEAIRVQDLGKMDLLLRLPAVKALAKSKDKKAAATGKLLDVFVNGYVKEFLAFQKSAPKGLLKGYGLDSTECLSHMRTLTLCSLGEKSEEVPYKTLEEALAIAATKDETFADQVEAAVIDAVLTKKIDACIDQVNEVVLIRRTTKRVFKGKEDWANLAEKLEAWRGTVTETLNQLGRGDN